MHTNRTDYDVVIVGARCAGAATAMLLARQGVRVLVVDRAAETSDTLSTHALMRGGVPQLRRWGLLDPVIDAGTPAIRQTEFHYGNVVTNITIKPALGVDALYAPRRTVLDPLLVAAARQAGAQFRFGLTLADVTRDGDERVIGIIVTDTHGRTTSLRVALVIGADGRRSRVARCVRAPVERQGSPRAPSSNRDIHDRIGAVERLIGPGRFVRWFDEDCFVDAVPSTRVAVSTLTTAIDERTTLS